MAEYDVVVVQVDEGEEVRADPAAIMARGTSYLVPAEITTYHMLQVYLQHLLSISPACSYAVLQKGKGMRKETWVWRALGGDSITVPEEGLMVRIFKPKMSYNIYERDATFELRDQMAVPARPLPSYSELWDFVRRPPGFRFPVPPQMYLMLPSQNREKIFRPANPNENCLRIAYFVQNLIEPPAAGGSEDNFHHLYDALISDVLAFFFVVEAWVRIRNQAGEGSSGILRPDMIARFAQLYALFRAEEKGPRTSGDPAKELTDKMEWTYGTSIPYILGYYAKEYLVTFCSLRCEEGVNLRDDIVTLDLLKVTDRIELFIICLNLTRLLMTLRDLCISKSLPADMTEFKRENGKLVQIYGRKVVKIYDEPSRFEQVIYIYSELEGCPSAEVLLHYNREERSLVVERGFTGKPASVKHLVECLYYISTALVWLHDHNLMHRDIRWENVARRFDGKGWFLLDFDEACGSPSPGPHRRLRPETHAPEMTCGKHATSVDVWGFGYLLSTWDSAASWPDGLVDLKTRCLDTQPENRPSARDCFAVMEPLYQCFFGS